MSTSPTPPHDPAGPHGDPDPATPKPGTTARRGALGIRPAADFDLMLALRGAAQARDLRNRVVRPRAAGARDNDPPRDLAHSN